jgi:hypothetical protein
MYKAKKTMFQKLQNRKEVEKMKKIMLMLLVGLFCVTTAYANSITVNVQASIPVGTPEMTIALYKCDGWDQAQRNNPWLGQSIGSMEFGELLHRDENGVEVGQWYGRYFFFVAIFTSSFGNQYVVSQQATHLTGGGFELPIGCFGYVPDYSALDEWSPGHPQGDMPQGAQLGIPMHAAGTNGYIYISELAATNRIIRAFYSIPRPEAAGPGPVISLWSGYEAIPLSQPGATYTGTVTLTIAPY